jgi:hypothetical protein
LFHAAALFKLFQLSKEMKKNITPEELQRWVQWFVLCQPVKVMLVRNVRSWR